MPNKYVGGEAGGGGGDGGGAWEEMVEVSERRTGRVKRGEPQAIQVLKITHAGAVEEVADGQQCGQDVTECPVFLQLVHPFLQVLERFCHFLKLYENTVRKDTT